MVSSTAVNCGSPSDPGPNGVVSASQTTFTSVARYTCAIGHELVPDNSARICQADRTWSGTDPVCQGMNCAKSRVHNNKMPYGITTTISQYDVGNQW